MELVFSSFPPCCLQHFLGSACAHIPVIFSSGNTNSIFALDYISGALTLNGPLDRENPFYSSGFILTVKVGPAPAGEHILPFQAANLACAVLSGTQSDDALTK